MHFDSRDYETVFRLIDGVATDTVLGASGLRIFNAFAMAEDDWHPNAHACRLKISLVTIDSGMSLPWDLTVECSRYILKLTSVSSSCRLALAEELQLLDSERVVMDKESKDYQEKVHSDYIMCLCYNRQQQIRAILSRGAAFVGILQGGEGSDQSEILCRAPPRLLTSSWPFYMDNTVFGEHYKQMLEIESANDGEHSWDFEVGFRVKTDTILFCIIIWLDLL